jgi:hypothetical protein
MQRIIVYFESWAGRTALSALLVGVTPKRYRVKWLEDGLGRQKGKTGLVPKYACSAMYGERLPD